MKILHLTTSMSGGAGIASRRICQAQSEFGMSASLVGGQIKSDNQITKEEALIQRPKTQEVLSSAVTLIQSNFIQKGQYLTTPISINAVSLNDSRILDADVINIHAFYNLLSTRKISQLAKFKKVVVTLHDQRFFTGGCHYSLECSQYKTTCSKCPQVNSYARWIVESAHRAELDRRDSFDAITYVTPSEWLREKAEESSLLKGSRIEVINNPIPDLFRRIPDTKKSEIFTIGFVSENLNNPYKGVSTLINAVNLVSKNHKIVLRLFGNGKLHGLIGDVEIIYSRFDSDLESVSAFNKCDVIVIPSIQDNSPSVLSESIMCGVPVIASKVGGITEVLTKFRLPGFDAGNFLELADLLDFHAANRPSFDLWKSAKESFSFSAVARKYHRVYEQLLHQ